jgi:hypothetical protein
MRHKIFIVLMTVVIFLTIINLTFLNSQPSTRMKHGFYIGANGGGLFPEYFFMYRELGYKTNVDWGFSGDWQPWAIWMGNDNRIYGGFFDTLTGLVPLYPPPPPPPPGTTWLPSGYLNGVNNFMTGWYNSTQVSNTAF